MDELATAKMQHQFLLQQHEGALLSIIKLEAEKTQLEEKVKTLEAQVEKAQQFISTQLTVKE